MNRHSHPASVVCRGQVRRDPNAGCGSVVPGSVVCGAGERGVGRRGQPRPVARRGPGYSDIERSCRRDDRRYPHRNRDHLGKGWYLDRRVCRRCGGDRGQFGQVLERDLLAVQPRLGEVGARRDAAGDQEVVGPGVVGGADADPTHARLADLHRAAGPDQEGGLRVGVVVDVERVVSALEDVKLRGATVLQRDQRLPGGGVIDGQLARRQRRIGAVVGEAHL